MDVKIGVEDHGGMGRRYDSDDTPRPWFCPAVFFYAGAIPYAGPSQSRGEKQLR
jgi:hypothetical protein